jgi:hypothetical protein
MNTMVETQFEFDFMKPEQYTLNLDKNIYSYIGKASVSLYQPTYLSITFKGKNQEDIGVLDWSDGKMKFTGDADESAQLFFDTIIKIYVQTTFPFGGQKS